MQLKAKVFAVLGFGVLIAVLSAGLVWGIRSFSAPAAAPNAPVTTTQDDGKTRPLDAESAAEGRAILNRVWFDRLPSSSKEDADLWIFLSGGLGVQISGSFYRWSTELFDLERAKNRLELVTLQDKKTIRFTFEIKACDEKPPFDLCLHPSEPLRGKKVLYGFGDEEDAANRYGWLRDAREHGRGEAAAAAARRNLK